MELKNFLNENCKAIIEAAVTEIPYEDIKSIINGNDLAENIIKEYFSGDKFIGITEKSPEAIDILNEKFAEHGVFEDIEIKEDDEHFYSKVKIYNDKNVGYVAYIECNNKVYYIWNA